MPTTPNGDNKIFAFVLGCAVAATIWCGLRYDWMDDAGHLVAKLFGG